MHNFFYFNIPRVPYSPDDPGDANWVDLYHRLFYGRYIFLGKPLDKPTADHIIKCMIFLNQTDKEKKDFFFFLNCRGGGLVQGVGVFDTMQYVKADVNTIGIGLNASMGAFLLHGGTVGKRIMTENSSMMIHQPRLSPYDFPSDPEDTAFTTDQMSELRWYVQKTYISRTNQSREEITYLLERDVYLSPKQAVDLNFIDEFGKEFGYGTPFYGIAPDDLSAYKQYSPDHESIDISEDDYDKYDDDDDYEDIF
uniref:acetyl-CoA ATP-dependent Clp protease proteolytic subunit n=1 Tax=Athrotaxis cupressoides TaxID=99817 RepID=UPI001D103D0D|nr:acetyl-CoA ATP-dependent Clp protease proteolytic subunit [Athrotaxis cupressoides]QZN07928.1 acetyl-CoA ATP-dependent Clp protease proteolytic subunit [Athrotaxis cupressoides]